MAEETIKFPGKAEEKENSRPAEWRPLESLRRELDRLFNEFGVGSWRSSLTRGVFDVDLKLLAGRRLKPRRGSRLRCQRAPIWCHRPLADEKALLGDQLLANDIRVATMALKPLPQPALLPIKNLPARRLLVGPPAASLDVALDRVATDPKRARNATRTKTQLLQPEQGRYRPRL